MIKKEDIDTSTLDYQHRCLPLQDLRSDATFLYGLHNFLDPEMKSCKFIIGKKLKLYWTGQQ